MRRERGDLTTGERVIRAALQAGTFMAQREAMWQLVLNLRYQGRLTEAAAVARRYRTVSTPLDSGMVGLVTSSAAPLASVLYEAGRFREAAALFDSMSHWRAAEEPPSGIARERTWRLTLAARSLAAAGDTAAVAALADTVDPIGHRVDMFAIVGSAATCEGSCSSREMISQAPKLRFGRRCIRGRRASHA